MDNQLLRLHEELQRYKTYTQSFELLFNKSKEREQKLIHKNKILTNALESCMWDDLERDEIIDLAHDALTAVGHYEMSNKDADIIEVKNVSK